MVVSWAGLRGAASIVFAIMTVISLAHVDNDIFHIVMFIVLFSILIQGSLIPFVSKKLIIMIRRGESIIIPRGNTRLKENDVLVINEPDN